MDNRKFHELLTHFDTAMLVTHGSNKGFHTRPMAIACVEQDSSLYFFTSRESSQVKEVLDDADVQVVCQSKTAYLSVAGHAHVVRDQSKIDKLWNDSYKVWFKGGKTDPKLVLLLVQPTEGEYWDQHGSNGIKYAFEALKAYATGTRPQIDGDIHGVAKFS